VSRAEFILNITNDAWFDGSIGPMQHAHHARVRSAETGLPMLRASNSGTTIVVDPLGRITARLAEKEVALIDAVPARPLPEGTVYGRLGDWPFFGMLALGLLLSVLAAWRERRSGA
jgi:apolipoprotein N-acyltransferase